MFKSTVLALLIPLVVFGATRFYTHEAEKRKSERLRYDQVLGSLADAKIALAALYQPCFNTEWAKCRADTDEKLANYRSAVARFGLAVRRYEPDLDPSIQMLQAMDGSIADELRQVWDQYTACIAGGKTVPFCDEERRRAALIYSQVTSFVMEYLACVIEDRYAGKEKGSGLGLRCWAIIAEREEICRDKPIALVEAFADAIEKGSSKGLYRIDFHAVAQEIIDRFILPGSGLQQPQR